jgi:hypothetical protein
VASVKRPHPVLLPSLPPRGTAPAVAVSSVLLGLTHLVNLVLGAPLSGVVLQVLFAGMGAAGRGSAKSSTKALTCVNAAGDRARRSGAEDDGVELLVSLADLPEGDRPGRVGRRRRAARC